MDGINVYTLVYFADSSYGGKSIPDLLVPLMSRDQPSDTQLAAAKCATNLHRAHALSAEDPRILYKALPVLVSSL